MKRAECSIEGLKNLGYVAKKRFVNNWLFNNDTTVYCDEKQSAELFEVIANIIKTGGSVDIRRNNFNYEVNIFADCCKHEFKGREITYFLSRPMNEAEQLEADLYTGMNKMIKVSKDTWDKIHTDYKGVWQNYHDDHPEWIDRKVVMSTCITGNPNEKCSLLVEGVHFVIEN